MMMTPPFRVDQDINNVVPVTDTRTRALYLTGSLDGSGILDLLAKYETSKAYAYVLRTLYGPNAPPEFQSIKADGRMLWEYKELGELNRPVYKKHVYGERMATFTQEIAEKLHWFLRHMHDYTVITCSSRDATVFQRFNIPFSDDIKNSACAYILKEFGDMVFDATHNKRITNKAMAEPSPVFATDAVNRLLHRCPTTDITSRMEYAMSEIEGYYLGIQLARASETSAPLVLFRCLWGCDAPERFQSLVCFDKLETIETIYEICRERTDTELEWLQKVYDKRQEVIAQKNAGKYKGFMEHTRAVCRPIDPFGLDKFVINTHTKADINNVSTSTESVPTRLVRMMYMFLEELAIKMGTYRMQRFLAITNDHVESAAHVFAKGMNNAVACM